MDPQLLDTKSAESDRGRPPTTWERGLPDQRQRSRGEQEGGPANGDPRRTARSAGDLLSATERRRRSEALAHVLAGAADIGELVVLIKEHGRPAVARAAAVRPDLVPEINGEFPHIALSLADLD